MADKSKSKGAKGSSKADKPELSETAIETRKYLSAWRSLSEVAENFGITNLAARNRVNALRDAGVSVESRVRDVRREPGAPGRPPHEYRIERTASAPATDAAPKRARKPKAADAAADAAAEGSASASA